MLSLKRSWALSILLVFSIGMVLRCASLNYSFGPQTLDDYRHALFPGLQWSQGQTLNVPPYRSHLLIWGIGLWFKCAQSIGLVEPLSKLKMALFGIHLLSFCFPLGLYFFLRRQKEDLVPLGFLALFCLNPIVIFTSSRILGESVSAPFLFLGLSLLYDFSKNESRTSLIGSLFFVGLATLLRFQVGVVFVMILAKLVYQKKWKHFGIGIFVGLVILSAQILIDHASGKPFLGSLVAYLEINKNGGAEFGVTPWYTTWLTFFGLFLFPISWPILKPAWVKSTQIQIIVGFVVGFVLLHSLMSHKEERFLFPIVPVGVFLIFLWIQQTTQHKYTMRFFVPLYGLFNAGFLVLGLFSNSQGSVVDPITSLNTSKKKTLVVDVEPKFGVYGLREFFFTPNLEYKEISVASELNSFLGPRTLDTNLQIVILTGNSQVLLPIQNMECELPQKFHSWSDQIVFYLNPEANYRRAPTWRSICHSTHKAITTL